MNLNFSCSLVNLLSTLSSSSPGSRLIATSLVSPNNSEAASFDVFAPSSETASLSVVTVVVGVVVACVVVVGLGVVMGILLGVVVVVATRIGILELYPFLSPTLAPAPTERSEWRPGPGAAFWVQNSELEWTEGCCRYQGGSGLKTAISENIIHSHPSLQDH